MLPPRNYLIRNLLKISGVSRKYLNRNFEKMQALDIMFLIT